MAGPITKERDYPFYNGNPVALSAGQWWLVLAAVALAAAILLAPVPLFQNPFWAFIPAVLFAAIPLLALRAVAGRHWKALFHSPGWQGVGMMFAFALLNLVVTVTVGMLVSRFMDTTGNPVFGGFAGQSKAMLELFFARTLFQLLGEELFTILPLLALLSFFHTRLGWARAKAVLVAWLITAIVFALIHLPAYGWNFLQCILIIGSARLVLSLAYLKTKNLWVSAGAHIINDWALFLLFIGFAG